MRISKAPEERKQEMIDTAMKLFASKGYEATTMTDIAKEMNVVSGLCYRYFKSKEELYHTALHQYAAECAAPYVRVLSSNFDTFEEYSKQMMSLFCNVDGKEKYHEFFDGAGNEYFHHQLEYEMINQLHPYFTKIFEQLQQRGIIHVTDCSASALFILSGQMPIIRDNQMPSEKKAKLIHEFIVRVLQFQN